jgi:hypothetical protein
MEMGIFRPNNAPWSEKEDVTVKKMHNEGKSCSEIAAILTWRTERAVYQRLISKFS